METLLEAAFNNDIQQVRELIEAGVDVNQPLEDRDTVLMFAAREGYLDIVKILVEAGADANVISYQGDNALVQAAWGGWQEVFDYLRPLTSPEVREWAQKDALLGAAADNNIKALQLLLKFGIDLNTKSEDEGDESWTPLMIATELRNIEFVEALLELKAEVNARDNNGKTALMLAAKYRNDVELRINGAAEIQASLVQMLAEAEADLNLADNDGKTALMLAAEFGSPEAVSVLIQKGCDINKKDNRGNTALTYAEKSDCLLSTEKMRRSEIIRLLLKAGVIED
ncbi:ankyrin repeat domain-containing protein [Phormidium nigroviride]